MARHYKGTFERRLPSVARHYRYKKERRPSPHPTEMTGVLIDPWGNRAASPHAYPPKVNLAVTAQAQQVTGAIVKNLSKQVFDLDQPLNTRSAAVDRPMRAYRHYQAKSGQQ